MRDKNIFDLKTINFLYILVKIERIKESCYVCINISSKQQNNGLDLDKIKINRMGLYYNNMIKINVFLSRYIEGRIGS
jgi:hypothetical protein